jgi:hypothetical protein
MVGAAVGACVTTAGGWVAGAVVGATVAGAQAASTMLRATQMDKKIEIRFI